jgi:hypothetical protein
MFDKRSNGKSHFKQEGRIMSDWVGAILKRVERFMGYNWIELLDEGARPAVRRFAQRCSKCGARCVNWVKRIGRTKKRGIRRELSATFLLGKEGSIFFLKKDKD